MKNEPGVPSDYTPVDVLYSQLLGQVLTVIDAVVPEDYPHAAIVSSTRPYVPSRNEATKDLIRAIFKREFDLYSKS